ncbi:putative C2H2 transcription factor [Aspergillus lucknowensis]|uniref:C2H2-type domain-containing protein n=1 Tax=Aspergillus lucknowensis TaxID=176173 RepID=A0ABR4LKI3_9EURO
MLVAPSLSDSLHGRRLHCTTNIEQRRTWNMEDSRSRRNRYSSYSMPPTAATMDNTLLLAPDSDPNSLLYASTASFAPMHHHHHSQVQMPDYLSYNTLPQLESAYYADPQVQPYTYHSATNTSAEWLQQQQQQQQHASHASSLGAHIPSPDPDFDMDLDVDTDVDPSSSPPTTGPSTGSQTPRRALSTSSTTSNTKDLSLYGTPHLSQPGTWRCAYPGCTSPALFRRGCDLRKHYNRHRKHLFCRVEGCPQSNPQNPGAGFSSKKDRDRHEAKHNPGIMCEWAAEGCTRVFSRVDNMKDHVRRIHQRIN